MHAEAVIRPSVRHSARGSSNDLPTRVEDDPCDFERFAHLFNEPTARGNQHDPALQSRAWRSPRVAGAALLRPTAPRLLPLVKIPPARRPRRARAR